MSKYENLSKNILEAVGGKNNIVSVLHCMTRLRFNVKDRSLVDLKKIENMEKVMGVQWSNDELQVIIGAMVRDVYTEFCEYAGFEKKSAVSENLDNDLPREKQKITPKLIVTKTLDAIVGSITPLIPMMIGAGLLKSLAMVLNVLGVLPADSSTYQVIMWAGDGFVYFLPIFLGATSAKKFGTNIGLGMLLGGILIYPNFIAAVTEGTAMTILGLPIHMTNYANSVIPVILSVFVFSKIEKLVNKICPDVLKSTFVPVVSLLIMLPVMLVAVAPIGFYIGTFVTSGIIWAYETVGVFGVVILSALFPLLVMTGMHTTMRAYWLPAISTLGYEPFYLVSNFISNATQAAACLAVAIRAKNKNTKSIALSCSISAFIGGITEPAMFGVTLKYKKPLYAAMVGNIVGGLIAGLMKVYCYAIPGSGGIFGFVTFISDKATSNFFWFMVAIVTSMIVAFVLSLFLGIKEEE